MDQDSLKLEIKRLLIRELDLRGRQEADILDDAPLFGPSTQGEGLGLDSLDALQLAMALEERFGVPIPEGDQAKAIFASVRSVAEYIANANTG